VKPTALLLAGFLLLLAVGLPFALENGRRHVAPQGAVSSRVIQPLQFQVEANYSGGGLPISGRVEGWVHLQGPWTRLVSQGELFSRNGTFRQRRFELATLRFSGLGPILQIQDSGIRFPGESMRIEGSVDLRRIGQPHFFRQVRLNSTGKSMTFGGWEVSPVSVQSPGGPMGGPGGGASGLVAQRMTEDEKVSVHLAYEVDEEIRPEPMTHPKVEVGYSLSEQERLKVRLDRDENFLGVEHRKRF
jgi:hypothetical protein